MKQINKVIMPIKPNKRIINPKDCVGCVYRSKSNRINVDCKSCGNFKSK